MTRPAPTDVVPSGRGLRRAARVPGCRWTEAKTARLSGRPWWVLGSRGPDGPRGADLGTVVRLPVVHSRRELAVLTNSNTVRRCRAGGAALVLGLAGLVAGLVGALVGVAVLAAPAAAAVPAPVQAGPIGQDYGSSVTIRGHGFGHGLGRLTP